MPERATCFSNDNGKELKDLLPLKVPLSRYESKIPDEMNYNRLYKAYYTLFGVDIMEIYKERKVKDLKEILISDFASTNDGFFWVQVKDELESDEFQIIFDMINNYTGDKLANLSKKWCIAKYEGEWFRAYIEEVFDDGKRVKVFFIDYGTTAMINIQETRQYDDDELWIVGPMAIPCVFDCDSKEKLKNFKKFQYNLFTVTSLKLIEGTCIFEVDLMDEYGHSLDSLL